MYRDRKWLAAVGSIDECVMCGGWGTQVAHRNEGKGMGMKAPDCWTSALCQECHHQIDNGRDLTKQQRKARIDEAVLRTLLILVEQGRVKVC